MAQNSDNETVPLKISEAPKPRKKNCFHVLRDEFHWRSFCLDFPTAHVFYRSQWRWPRLVFVVFRLCLAAYTVVTCVLTLVYFPKTNPQVTWIAWLTNWSYLTLTCHEVCSAVIAVLHSTDGTVGWCCREREQGARGEGDDDDDEESGGSDGSGRRAAERCSRDHPGDAVSFYMKLDWVLFYMASPAALFLTSMMFLDPRHLTVKSIINHYLNSLVILLEFCIAALPVRLLHVVYGSIYFTLFFLSTLVYWTLDHNTSVTYVGFIDWNYFGDTMVHWVYMSFFVAPVCQISFFIVYRFRLFVFSKIYGDEICSDEMNGDY